MKRITYRVLLFILGGILGLLVLYHLYLNFQPEIRLLLHFDSNNEKLLVQMVRSHGLSDVIFLFILNAICVAIPGLSNGIFCVLNGLLYGPAFGFIINWISDILGQSLLLLLLQHLYTPKNLEHSKIYELMSGNHPQISLTIGYLIPFIPCAPVAYMNTLINSTYKKRIIPVAIGTMPMAYLYAYRGDSILHLDTERLIKVVIIFVIIALVSMLFLFTMRKIKNHAKKA